MDKSELEVGGLVEISIPDGEDLDGDSMFRSINGYTLKVTAIEEYSFWYRIYSVQGMRFSDSSSNDGSIPFKRLQYCKSVGGKPAGRKGRKVVFED